MHVLQTNVRSSPRSRLDVATAWARDPAHAALLLTGVAWAVVLMIILTQAVFVTNDSLNNYIHVWYIADRLWHGGGVPLRMPVLGHGDAFAFPYGFIPWLSAALLRPLFGDWIVTLWLVVGFLGVVVTQWWAFPELRRGWWPAMLLVNPMLVESPLLGQLPFLWAAAMLFAAIACWRRGQPLLAALLIGAAQATHPAVIMPIAGVILLVWLYWEPRRLALIGWYALSLLIAAPAVWIVLASPSVADASTGTLLKTFFGTVILRALVVGAPFIGIVAMRTPLTRIQPLLFAGLIALTVALIPVRHNEYALGALTRAPDESLLPFVRSGEFVPGATYRILRVGDGKVGMYDLLKAGAKLDSEPFPESIDRRSFATPDQYLAFLAKRRVDYVLIYDAYDTRYETNEHHLLKEMTSSGGCASVAATGDGYEVYRIAHDKGCAGPG
jgi:hypothetical protein